MAIGNFLSIALLLLRDCKNVHFKEQVHELLLLLWFHNLFKRIRKVFESFACENKVPTVWNFSDILVKQLLYFVFEVFVEIIESFLNLLWEIRFYEVI